VAKIKIIAEYLLFLKEHKKWWIAPIVIILLLLGLLIVLGQGSALAPFIYTLF
jgi:NAD/NADP transhydrogenase beta subunit